MIGRRATCRACGLQYAVMFSDGVPLRSPDVMVMFPVDGSTPTVLHNGCEKGDDDSPVFIVEGWP